ncbi:MAG TPA: helix-turn-helix transcriptional regulator [Accumulibacter sp.]|uniref:helix-turn-helix domain-containing protein n=1 Tax=Accumulibacter sp. TaxID=2053492 RepID=UPI0025E95DAE|nr:helix-turn-helix transcriptional regulator [Accumulibacter sp.]MCM8597733.1 helix-turn-helix domain-containing protein [Accumulibacter sp.]MCM8661907.1 helix-turn-helix domain-containing protein [Accumulibacter sp.]HNC52390.1 helix-turn-helix transcriptional regulator [Accumulibacter sp.]
MSSTQQQTADLLGVSFVTLDRRENEQSKPSAIGLSRLRALACGGSGVGNYSRRSGADVDSRFGRGASAGLFPGDANALRVLFEGERLSDGHLFDPAFAIEIGEIDPPPHQRIAVYQRTLLQHRLRLLLADEAGAGKTIMTGLASTSARACRAGGSAASWWATGTANCTSCSSCSSGS